MEERRKKVRRTFASPVEYSDRIYGDFQEARMCNVSEDGMTIEADDLLKSGSSLYVKLTGTKEVDRAKVIWCKEIIEPKNPIYECGLEFSKPVVH